jgi:hypothetical protein
MSDQPTAEEIERVKAWERQQSSARNAEAARARKAAQVAARSSMQTKLAGRTIAYIDGDLSYLDEWSTLRLVFTDGGHIEIGSNRWSDTSELEIDTGETIQCQGALLDRMRVVRDSDQVTLVEFFVPRGMSVSWEPPFPASPWHWEREQV